MLFLVLLKESLIFAIGALVANKLRTFLSLLGITIGIFAIVAVFTVVDSLESNLRGSIETLGNNVVYVQKWPWEFGEEYPWWKYMNRPVPNIEELDIIKKRSKTAEAAAFHVATRKTIKFKNYSIENATITGGSHDYEKIVSFEIEDGRYFTDAESAAGRNVCMIGNAIAQGLFPNGDSPIGKTVKIFGRNLFVIGVFKKEGESLFGNSMDAQVLVPLEFISNLVDMKNENIDPFIAVRAKPGVSNEQLMDELTGLLRSERQIKPLNEDDFALNEIKLLSKGFDPMFDGIGFASWIIGMLAILVGGFGIANIMFVSVKERTNLIGIQKSLGAKNFFILFQFLSESIFLSLIGGLIGLLLIYILVALVGDVGGMQIKLSSGNVILGITVSILIGIISGFVPAYSASQLDPVEAIRTN